MECLAGIRDDFYWLDQNLSLILETYSMFHKFQLSVPAEDTDRVEGLKLMFNSMNASAKDTAEKLFKIQTPLLEELKVGISKFQDDLKVFEEDFVTKGPLVPDLPPRDACGRVLIFNDRCQTLSGQYLTLSSAEELFGMDVHKCPVLEKRLKDLSYLKKLYDLYKLVIDSIDSYKKYQFREIDMEKINKEIQEFIHKSKLLPKALKEWPAFIELKDIKVFRKFVR